MTSPRRSVGAAARAGEGPGARLVACADADAFYASVEAASDPRLRGLPFAVGHSVVTSASYEARKFGVHSAMPTAQARRLCPDLVVVSPHFDRYGEVTHRLLEIYRRASPVVEAASQDEAYLDLSAAQPEAAVAAARAIRETVRRDLAITVTIGLGPNKLVAKVAASAAKPDGLLLVRAEEAAAFLAPLAAETIPGVGPVTAARLREIGIATVGDLAAAGEARLWETFGSLAGYLARAARGEDDSPVVPREQGGGPRSLSAETTFQATVARPSLVRTLEALCAEVAERFADDGLAARTLTLKVRYQEGRVFRTITRAHTGEPTRDPAEIFARLLPVLDASRTAPIRLLGVAGSNLIPMVGEQTSLLGGPADPAVTETVEKVRERFGPGSIRKGTR